MTRPTSLLNVYTGVTYGPANEMQQIQYAAGTTASRQYNSLLQMTRLTAPGAFDVSYNFSAGQKNGKMTPTPPAAPSSGGAGSAKVANQQSGSSNIPRACGGGGFLFFGPSIGNITFAQYSLGIELLALVQYDTQSGFSYGGLLALEIGPFALGLESMRDVRTWQVSTAAIGLGGREKEHLGKIATHVGGGGFVTSSGSAGGYINVGSFGGGLYGTAALQRCQ